MASTSRASRKRVEDAEILQVLEESTDSDVKIFSSEEDEDGCYAHGCICKLCGGIWQPLDGRLVVASVRPAPGSFSLFLVCPPGVGIWKVLLWQFPCTLTEVSS
jgi:hypothetical protein